MRNLIFITLCILIQSCNSQTTKKGEEKKKTNKQISYYQYAKLMESEGSDFNIDDYVKP
ncbi:hypothetical protein AAEO57_09000 [Flavobacterium sp. DGU38]|uniref:Uncharacterized protein n=1 Tax=Flavobacterium calami TaxID=3139144 RepID=A0ABU9IQE5_9FLAO